MDDKQKTRLSELKDEAKKKIRAKNIENNILLQECFRSLADYKIISDEKEIEDIISITGSDEIEVIRDHACITKIIEDTHLYYIVWDDADTPIIECKGTDIIKCWDDIMAVAFYTCFIDKEQKIGVIVRG